MFCDLCEMGALLKWAAARRPLAALERGYMKEYGYSPLVYWSQQKQAVRPLLLAGGDTLRALGVPVEGDPTTVHALADAVAEALAEDLGEYDVNSDYWQIAADVERRLSALGL